MFLYFKYKVFQLRMLEAFFFNPSLQIYIDGTLFPYLQMPTNVSFYINEKGHVYKKVASLIKRKLPADEPTGSSVSFLSVISPTYPETSEYSVRLSGRVLRVSFSFPQ